MLKLVYATQAEIPAEYAGLYTEREGKWVLTGVEGIKTQADIDRINGGLTKERSDHAATKEKLRVANEKLVTLGADADDFDVSAAADKLSQFDDVKARAEANGAAQSEAQIQQRISEARNAESKKWERRLQEAEGKAETLKAEKTELSSKITRGNIERAVRAAATVAKVNPDVIDDVVLMGVSQFKEDEAGNILTETGVKPDDWLNDMKPNRPSWWPKAVGAGSEGGGVINAADNPFSKGGWNVTKQAAMQKADAAKATRFAQAAGHKDPNTARQTDAK